MISIGILVVAHIVAICMFMYGAGVPDCPRCGSTKIKQRWGKEHRCESCGLRWIE